MSQHLTDINERFVVDFVVNNVLFFCFSFYAFIFQNLPSVRIQFSRAYPPTPSEISKHPQRRQESVVGLYMKTFVA